MRLSSDLTLTSTIHQSITTMNINDTTDDSCQYLMHQTNDEIRIGENDKVTQHDPDFENADEGDDEDNLEAPRHPIIAVNFAKNNACVRQIENILEGRTRSRPHSSFAPFDSNCPKQQIIFNFCDQIDLQTIQRVKELYTDTCGININ